ncbi:hypothetical protein TBS_08960 [Thermobispora bispora]
MVTGPLDESSEDERELLSSEPQAAVTPRASVAATATASLLPRRDLSIIPDPSQVVVRIINGRESQAGPRTRGL